MDIDFTRNGIGAASQVARDGIFDEYTSIWVAFNNTIDDPLLQLVDHFFLGIDRYDHQILPSLNISFFEVFKSAKSHLVIVTEQDIDLLHFAFCDVLFNDFFAFAANEVTI